MTSIEWGAVAFAVVAATFVVARGFVIDAWLGGITFAGVAAARHAGRRR